MTTTTTAVLDPFAALEEAARRQVAEETALRDLSHARAKMVLGKDAHSVFLATLALRLRPGVSWDCDTACTDGKSLWVNPEWFSGLPPAERVGIVAHEVLHPVMRHHTRRGDRQPRRWNIAADAAINPLLREAGYAIPECGIFPGEGEYADLPAGLSAEEYYALLPDDPDDSGGSGDDPGGCGAVQDAAGDDAGQAAAEARVAVAQAQQASKQRGELPAGLARLVGEILQPKIDWRDVLREFLSRSLDARDDYSWSAPNRRFVAQGIYLPSLRSESLGEVVVAIDTSGSIGQAELDVFGAEVAGVLESRPSRAHIVYCDAAVQRVDEWEPSDGPLSLDPVGGGGTSHRPIWKWLDDSGTDAACVICLTDGATDFGADPGVPVLWVLTADANPPFGRSIRLE